ncbi:MAG: hypothetical protein AVO34_01670 [Firmicutes bacterium ML8_F2]|nr:MAG: hypothetical protein AVO34_01670 [Firmicutes bacterium ML8_F2]
MARQYNGMFLEIENCQKEKAEAERQLSDLQEQISGIGITNNVLATVLNSFMIPGDLKAITIGSQEAAEIEQKISNIADSKDRMMMEQNWSDFKTSKLLNSLFNLLRDGVNNIERTLAPNRYE